MNNRAEAFKKKALQYERAANMATDADACRMYLGLARQLRVMAEQGRILARVDHRARYRSPAPFFTGLKAARAESLRSCH